MTRIVMRGFMIVLALTLATASAGTVLCEMDCAAGGHAESAAAITPMSNTSHCDGVQTDSARQEMGVHRGSSGGNRKHGAHLHTGIVATVGVRVLILPAIKFSEVAVASIGSVAPVFARADQNFWINNSSPPINSSFVFAASVLRI
jgi:hypothetical protein